MLALRYLHGAGEVVVPAITWVSDISAVIRSGFTPKFCDIDLRTLAPTYDDLINQMNFRTKAVFLTHVLGIAALDEPEIQKLASSTILVEDVCESHGAKIGKKKLGTFGSISNFSFYYAHHLTTMEGGMICTDSSELYEMFRMLRSHGLVREISDKRIRQAIEQQYSNLNREFIFKYAAHNMRPIELQAVLGLNQLPNLSRECEIRASNFRYFLSLLNTDRFFTDFKLEGNSNYALIVILNEADQELALQIETALAQERVEFRRGLSGGGNQLRQPYIRHLIPDAPSPSDFPNAEHVSDFGWYIGNYPELSEKQIFELCKILNSL
jgi:CDP-6-deoxy-D-xylo-4-hexulose-3-dehydrase